MADADRQVDTAPVVSLSRSGWVVHRSRPLYADNPA